MPRKKSIKSSADVFSSDADGIVAFLEATSDLGDEHVSWCHDLAVIRLYRAFECLMLDALVGALNNDTTTLAQKTGFGFPRHLTDEVCLFLVTGTGYFGFKGRDGLIKKLKDYLPNNHYLVSAVSDDAYRQPIELLSSARNYAAHASQQAKAAFKKATDQDRVGSAGSWLKCQQRFSTMVNGLKLLANEIKAHAPY